MSDDPYAALGVAKTATHDEIRKAYKKIAKESHPDLNPGDAKAAARFKAASAAHDLLKDPEKRARFDRGEIDAMGQERPERKFYREYAEGPEATYHTRRGYEDFGDMSDVFADLFGDRAGRAGGRRRGHPHARARPALYPRGGLPRGGAGGDAADHPAGRPGARREDPGGPRRRPDPPAARQGRRGDRRRAGGGRAGDGRRSPRTPSSGARATTSWWSCRSRSTRRCWAARSRCRPIDGRVALTVPKGASSGRVLRIRGRGVKRGGGRGDQLVTLKVVAPPRDRRRARGLLPPLAGGACL